MWAMIEKLRRRSAGMVTRRECSRSGHRDPPLDPLHRFRRRANGSPEEGRGSTRAAAADGPFTGPAPSYPSPDKRIAGGRTGWTRAASADGPSPAVLRRFGRRANGSREVARPRPVAPASHGHDRSPQRRSDLGREPQPTARPAVAETPADCYHARSCPARSSRRASSPPDRGLIPWPRRPGSGRALARRPA